eukprot:Nk52_evm11s2192 gene=Nk52_evmTU11s2192
MSPTMISSSENDVLAISEAAKKASHKLQSISSEVKNKALEQVKIALEERREEVIAANKRDLEAARIAVEEGTMSQTLLRRLDIYGPDGKKFQDLLKGLSNVQTLQDPTGNVTLAKKLSDDLELYKVSCPIGVICIIFEARPEVVIQISSLALKSGNAVILKGGKEASHTNSVLVQIVQDAICKVDGVPKEAVQYISTRQEVAHLLNMDKYIDLVIPRGSNSLVKYIQGNTRIPVLGHADGICSVYVDREADLKKAANIVVDSKTQYVAACNTAETLLVHKDIAKEALSTIAKAFVDQNKTIEFRADEIAYGLLPEKLTKRVSEEDYDTEFLDYILAVKVVDSLDDAIQHINTHGSHHTDCIVTENKKSAIKFMTIVDAAGVYHNASTRFADGFRYGFGAEIGVSTNKTHARGPVGLEGLVIYKYRLFGTGQTVSQFSTGELSFTHQPIEQSEYKF